MSTKEKAVSTETTTSHVDAAQVRLQELRAMRELIPRFVIPESSKAGVRLNNAASVPPEFVERTLVALVNQKALEHDGPPAAELRDLWSYADAYGPLADEAEAFAQFVRFSVNAARHAVGTEALAIYAIAQRLAKLPATAGLAPFVTDMRRALRRVRKLSPEAVAQREAAKAVKAAEKAAKAAEKAAHTAPKAPVKPKA